MILDYKEIPQANLGDGLQDTFELFARDFFEDLGFDIIQHPDRGADGKKDLIIGESRAGVIGNTYFKWLVSCKHYAHSGKSVSDTDEPDIGDRITAHKCDGFIGFYSTIAAVSLSGKLEGNKPNYESEIFERERIEKKILNHPDGIKLAKRYFPISIEKHITENPKPAKIFREDPKLPCDNCGSDLLVKKNGIFVALNEYLPPKKGEEHSFETSNIKETYFCCKGNCDNILKVKFQKKDLYDAGWEDIDDIMIPSYFLKHIMAFINNIFENEYDKDAFDKMKQLYINVFPHVAREMTEKEKERVSSLLEFGLM